MEKNQTEEYLKLSNKFKNLDHDHPNLDEIQQRLSEWHNTFEKTFPSLDLGDVDVETAVQVYEIFDTNTFHNGVFLKMSRFTNSCIANAEYFWNDEENVREIRSISNIAKGDEITISYCQNEVLETEKRREDLYFNWLFKCICPACDLSEENLEEEKKSCQKFREQEENALPTT